MLSAERWFQHYELVQCAITSIVWTTHPKVFSERQRLQYRMVAMVRLIVQEIFQVKHTALWM